MSTADSDPQALIAQAIQSARYNEAVVVTVNDGDEDVPREIVLVACLDKENGGIVWKDAALSSSPATFDDGANATDRRSEDDVGIVRHLRTKKWALPMLNDHRRNHLYNNAIREACSRVAKRRIAQQNDTEAAGEEEDDTIRILDIGSGTGLLALMNARHTLDAIASSAADKKKDQKQAASSMAMQDKPLRVQVTSVEMASAMARLARKTIEENDLSKNIVVVEKHSTDLDFGIEDGRFQGGETTKVAAVGDNVASSSSISSSTNNNGKLINNQKADICTSELLESGLLGEGVLPSIRDAWTRHLKPDAIVVPRRARVFAVLVEGMANNSENGDGNNKSSSAGTEDGTLNAATAFFGPELNTFREASGGVWLSTRARSVGEDDQLNHEGVLLGTRGCGSVKNAIIKGGITVPLHANAMLNEKYNGESTAKSDYRGIRPLTDPIMVLDFEFASGLEALPPPTGRSVTTSVVPYSDGVCHGVLFWWELDLWDGESDDSTYSSEPIGHFEQQDRRGNITNWQDHWQQCLFLFGDDHSASSPGRLRMLTKGAPIDVVSSHDDSSLSFSIRTTEDGQDKEENLVPRPLQRRRLNEGGLSGDQLQQLTLNRHISTTRALQLNDTCRIETLTKAIQHAVNVRGKDAPILDLSDMGLCAIIASLNGATKVTSLESSTGTMPKLAATIAQLGNELPKPGTEFQVLQALAEHITAEHVAGGAAQIVVAEPYYEMLEGWHLQEALNYFYIVRSLKARGVIEPSALSMPAYALIMGCIVQFDDFNGAYGPVGAEDMVAGFSHASVNYYGNRNHLLSFPLWQHRYKRLTRDFTLARLNFEDPLPTIKTMDDSVALSAGGVAHAVIIWVDYGCRTNSASETGGSEDQFDIVSTSSSSHRQIVQKLPCPIVVTESDFFSFQSSFDKDPDGVQDDYFSFDFCPRK